jgi:hypothetical protein
MEEDGREEGGGRRMVPVVTAVSRCRGSSTGSYTHLAGVTVTVTVLVIMIFKLMCVDFLYLRSPSQAPYGAHRVFFSTHPTHLDMARLNVWSAMVCLAAATSERALANCSWSAPNYGSQGKSEI